MIEFRREGKVGRFLDPRNGFAETEIESEIRRDPLTGDSGRICHFAFEQGAPVDLPGMLEASAESCPFCPGKVMEITPRFPEDILPEGRLERGQSVLFPNLFPYDDVSAIAVLSRSHFLPMDDMPDRIVADGLRLARTFFRRIEENGDSPPQSFGIVTWNYMPPAGASQVHPHMQVIHTTSPGNGLRRHLEAAEAWAMAHGRPYIDALIQKEKEVGERWIGESNGISWLVPFVPMGILGDCIAVFSNCARMSDLTDGDIAAFGKGLRAVLGAYAARGLWSFNLVFLPDHGSNKVDRHRLTVRLVPRLYINPSYHVTDVAYLQLILEEKFAMIFPEANAAQVRAHLERERDVNTLGID